MLKRLLQARPIRFTRFGSFYIFFSLAVGGAAINTGNNLLYLMLGLLLGFIIISGFLSDSCLWGLRATFQPAGDFYAGQPAEWDLVATKTWFPGIIVHVETSWKAPHPLPPLPQGEGTAKKKYPLPAGEDPAIASMAGGEASRCLFYWIPRHGSTVQRIQLTPSRRGLLRLEKVRFATRFPFGLFEKSHQGTREESFVVFPRVRMLSRSQLQAGGLSFSDQPANRKGPGAIPFDLREYKRGDSSKRIHWKSSAKRGELMVTEMEEESALSREVWVSAWPADPDSFIDFVASLVYTLHRQGLPVGLRTPDARFAMDRSRAQLKKILTYLALVDTHRALPSASSPGNGAQRPLDALIMWKRQRSTRQVA